MKTVGVIIKGISPLLMHSFPLVPIEALDKKPPKEQARLAEYRNADGALYIPGVNLARALVAAAIYSKGKGRGSLAKVASACIVVSPEQLVLDPQSYEVDFRAVVVPATKGRVLRYRPRFDAWTCKALIDYDENLMTEAQLRRIVDDCGARVGLLDYRPERKGPYGRFMVTGWKEM